MSPVALVFPKTALQGMGARQVIYGLSVDARASSGADGAPRIFPESALPLQEQYRFVTHNLNGARNVDWTHEREWRWPYRGDGTNCEQQAEEYGGSVSDWQEIPGLDFYRAGIWGIGVIVETARQANLVISDMLTLVDGRLADRDTFGFVLATSRLPAATQLQDPLRLSQEIADAAVDLEPYFSMSDDLCEEYSLRFGELVSHVEAAAGMPSWGEFGGCWLWLHDNTAPLTRALLRTGRAFVSKNGRYLAHLREFSDSRGLREREDMASRVAEEVSREFETSSCYFSVLNSDDPEAVPFYAGTFDDDIGFFNCAWNA